MKKPLLYIIAHIAAILITTTHASAVWPMFQRVDVVTLAGKEIPAEYKRTKITDNKGRSMDGEWLVIDRNAKIIKFRRNTDGKEFDIAFTNLSEPDRRYAELETGEIWATSLPIVLSPEARRKTLTVATTYNTYDAEWVRIDRDAKILYFRDKDGEGSYDFEQLSPDDRAYAEDPNTPSVLPPDKRRTTLSIRGQKREPIPGEWLEIDNAHEEVKFQNVNGRVEHYPFKLMCQEDREFAENKSGKNFPAPKFDPAEPRTDPQGYLRGNTIFDKAAEQLTKSFSPEEIFDHLRVRTLTTSFIYAYDEYWKDNHMNGMSQEGNKSKVYIKPLSEIMGMLAVAEPENETVSLKGRIEKSGITLFEEKAPTKPAEKATDTRTYGPAVDGETQCYHFAAQYIQISNKKPKLPYADVIAQSKSLGFAATKEAPMYFSFDRNVRAAIENSHHVKTWSFETFLTLSEMRDHNNTKSFRNFVNDKIARHNIRNNRPVVVPLKMPEHEGFAILTGYTLEKGKEPTYEAIVVEGPARIGSQLKLPYKITNEPKLELSKIDWWISYFIE